MFVITVFSLPNNGASAINGYYLNKAELQYMAQSGRWELQSHGDLDHRLYDIPSATPTNGQLSTIHQEHFLSNKFWLPDEGRVETNAEYDKRVTQDLQTSKNILETDFGKPVTAFAYPFNDYGQNTANYPPALNDLSNIVPSIYDFAFYQIDPDREDPFNYRDSTYLIKRVEPVASWSGADLVRILDSSAPKPLPYKNSVLWSEWSGNWGAVTPEGTGLSLAARSTTTGSVALINGSKLWKNYSLTTMLNWKKGADVSLIARYQGDSKSFLSCAYSGNTIALQTHQAGTQVTLASKPYTLENKNSVKFSMSVNGSTATCSAYGTQVEAQVGDAFLHSGSAGVQVWDATYNNASVTLQSVVVLPL
jgi:hypothetical protein